MVATLVVAKFITVDGREIYQWSNLEHAELVTGIRISPGTTQCQEYILDHPQINPLQMLLEESTFVRAFKNSLLIPGPLYCYAICIQTESDRMYTIHVTGNEYLRVDGIDQFNGMFLKIRNPDFQTKLEDILLDVK